MVKFIAECGLNHNGNHDLTYELIRQSSWAGADIVKFQLGWRDKKNEINALDNDRVKKIIEYCNYMEVEPMFSILTEAAYKTIKPFKLKKIKIASRSLKDNIKLVKKIVKESNHVIISLGMWNLNKLPFPKTKKITYMWCKSLYPTLPKDLENFPKKFNSNEIIGYSDHTIGIETPLLAISRGAELIEKHFSLDKSDTTIRDHALSATPDEFKSMVLIGKEINKLVKLKI
tara:strand:- start:3567 stop:4256 length:690 start_codon:yes stop_codon:yes gene_type:complete